jgi:hypothetical protein
MDRAAWQRKGKSTSLLEVVAAVVWPHLAAFRRKGGECASADVNPGVCAAALPLGGSMDW